MNFKTGKMFEQHQAFIHVLEERNRQDAKWGEQNHEQSVWLGILTEELGEYAQAINETVFDNGPDERAKGGIENMYRELSHVAAVAIAAMECLIRQANPDYPGK